MTKETLYLYLGTNGTILSNVHLEDIYYIRKYRIWADEGKVLCRNGKTYGLMKVIPEEELEEWYEIDHVDGQL